MKKLVFGFRRLLFDIEKGACLLVFDAPFSMSKTSFGFRHHFLYRLVGERYVEKQKRFLVFGFRRPDWTDLKPKKAEIIGVVFRSGGVLKTPPGQIGVVFYVETPPRFEARWCFQISGGVFINRALSVKVVAQMQMLESEDITSSNSLIAMTTHEQVLQWVANIAKRTHLLHFDSG